MKLIKTEQKMDDSLHKVKKSIEPVYDVVEICKSNHDDDTIKMDLNPSYNVSSTVKLDGNVHKDKGSTELFYDIPSAN